MSRWRRTQQNWSQGSREGFRERQWHLLDVSCARCRRVLGRSTRTVHGPGDESLGYEGEQAALMVFGPGVESFVLCEPCAGHLAAWVKAGPTAAERARTAHLTWGPEEVSSEVDAMRELRGKHE